MVQTRCKLRKRFLSALRYHFVRLKDFYKKVYFSVHSSWIRSTAFCTLTIDTSDKSGLCQEHLQNLYVGLAQRSWDSHFSPVLDLTWSLSFHLFSVSLKTWFKCSKHAKTFMSKSLLNICILPSHSWISHGHQPLSIAQNARVNCYDTHGTWAFYVSDIPTNPIRPTPACSAWFDFLSKSEMQNS